MKHILVPYDQSVGANRAFEYALDLATKNNSKISIVSCIHRPVPLVPVSTIKPLKENAIKFISKLEPKLKKSNISFKSAVLDSTSIPESLISYAEKNDVDLIVMGSRGLGSFKKLLLGSVASGVSQHSKCPVLIVK
jgi:nucleotide-binding universal stress UspA family protein